MGVGRLKRTRGSTWFNNRYLRLDCSNDPLTADLDLTGYGLNTVGDITFQNDTKKIIWDSDIEIAKSSRDAYTLRLQDSGGLLNALELDTLYFDSHLLPFTDVTSDIGSATKQIEDIYTQDLIASSNVNAPILYGTTQVNTNTIAEYTGATGVTIDGLQLKDGDIPSCGNVYFAAGKVLDMFLYGGVFRPRRVRQAAEPIPGASELMVWSDSDNDRVYLVYNDSNKGVVKIQLS